MILSLRVLIKTGRQNIAADPGSPTQSRQSAHFAFIPALLSAGEMEKDGNPTLYEGARKLVHIISTERWPLNFG